MNIGGINQINGSIFILKPIWDEIQEKEELKPIILFDDDISGNGLYLHESGHCVKVELVKCIWWWTLSETWLINLRW